MGHQKKKECNFLKPFIITLAEPTMYGIVIDEITNNNFDFQQIYVIHMHGDRAHQSHNLELLNFGMRCMNFGRLAHNPAVLQIFHLVKVLVFACVTV